MLNHDGRGGGTVHHFDGKTVFQATENRGEATVFFTNKDGGVVSIVGVGEHSGNKSDTATYPLVWEIKQLEADQDGKRNTHPDPPNQPVVVCLSRP